MTDKGEICINILLRAFGRMVCALQGHLRGKQSGIDILCDDGATKRTYQCDRCGATWSRKIRKPKIEDQK
jgi:hypothetical protein